MWKHILSFAFTILVFLSIFQLFHSDISAAGEFTADYVVSYEIKPDGSTIVTQKIRLTNKVTNLYPKQFSMVLDSDHIDNVIAFDDGGVIEPVIEKKDQKTILTLLFNKQNVGIGKEHSFTLRFENSDIAQKNGSIWEVNIPGISDNPDLGDYSVTLDVPETFGKNAYMSPLPSGLSNTWTKEQMISGGISAAYGSEQTFQGILSYILTNTGTSVKNATITIPPDSAFQKVSILNIHPVPEGIIRDDDGNWLASYKVNPKSEIPISVSVLVSVSLLPRPDFGTYQIDQSEYTKATRYWNTKDPRIQSFIGKYTSPKEIYDYVVHTFSYDYARMNANPKRMGASEALAEPSKAVCMEFTDAFIAIARANGISARQAIGYAYTTNTRLRPIILSSDILHTWPEYYDTDKKIWIGIDPTWAKTTGGVNYFDKMDFNHIVFAYNGVSDDTPLAAGMFRIADSGKQVRIDFADTKKVIHKKPNISVSVTFPKRIFNLFSYTGDIKIENNGGSSADNIPVSVSSDPKGILVHDYITQMPPYSHVHVPIRLPSSGGMTGKGIITAKAGDSAQRAEYEILSVTTPIIIIGIVFAAILGSVWYVIKRKKTE